jgi:hypothetical protein
MGFEPLPLSYQETPIMTLLGGIINIIVRSQRSNSLSRLSNNNVLAALFLNRRSITLKRNALSVINL